MAEEEHAVFARGEVEEAFAHWWKVGCVEEDWAAWVDLFVPDVLYHDHFWGPLHGRDEVALWIAAVMKGVPEIYTVLDWYTIDGDTVVFHCENRRDNPADEGPDFWDFAGLSMIRYAGDGLWASEEDFWDLPGARRTSVAYAEACRRAGADTPEQRMTRRFWPEGPAWARKDAPPSPSWVGSGSGVVVEPEPGAVPFGAVKPAQPR
jgi:hypothetical protein